MERDTLNAKEVAVKLGTVFTLVTTPDGQVINVDKDGTLSITVKYAVSPGSLLQYNPGPGTTLITRTVGNSGIFNDQTDLHFDQLIGLPTMFTLDYDEGNVRIWLEAEKTLFNLTSNADKGRQGITKSGKKGRQGVAKSGKIGKKI